MLDAVEARRGGSGQRQVRILDAVQIQPPRRAVIGRRRMPPHAVGRNRRHTRNRMIPARGRILEVRDQHAVGLADAEEVVHVLVVDVVDLRHPLGDERNRGDAARAREGGDAGAVAAEPRLERELRCPESRSRAERHERVRAVQVESLVRRIGQHRDRQRVVVRQRAVRGRELHHVGTVAGERRSRGRRRGVRKRDGPGTAHLAPLRRDGSAGQDAIVGHDADERGNVVRQRDRLIRPRVHDGRLVDDASHRDRDVIER